MYAYINFCFKNIEYDTKSYMANFSCPDAGVECNFFYNRDTGEIDIWDNNLPVEEILPIPIGWLDRRLKENGCLRNIEYKISY